MVASLSEPSRVTFSPLSPTPIKKLGIVGMGDCVRNKLWPILQTDAFFFDDVAVCSLEPHSAVNGFPHRYHQIQRDDLLPLDALHDQGFLTPETLWIVCTPSPYHVWYAVQLAGLCPVGLDKPIAPDSRHARLLRPFVGRQVYPLSHKLFNASALAFVDACRQTPDTLRPVCHIDGVFYERAGIGQNRQQEDTIADVQWHLFTTALIALFTAAVSSFEIMVEKVSAATHEPDPLGQAAQPHVWTASRVQGRLLGEWQEVTFDFRQAKGAPRDLKGVRLFDGAGNLLHTIDLNESGWQAYARMLLALTRPVVDMRLTLADAITAMELIDHSRKIACQERAYAFGTLPGFLAEEQWSGENW
ncbi:MAG: hypothetical protein AB7G75_10965 [Candidatus Binatia bacterium]